MTYLSVLDRELIINGKKLHYNEKPGRSEKTILFVHGRMMSAECWERQFNSDVFSDFRLIAIDLPGHGLSDRYDAYSFAEFVNVLVAVVKELKLTKLILAGLSLGGHIALNTLSELEHCNGVFCMTMPISKPMRPDLMYKCLHDLNKAYCKRPESKDIENYLMMLFRPDLKEIPELVRRAFYQADPVMHEGILSGVINGDYKDEVDIVSNSNIPVMVVAGSLDQIHELNYLSSVESRFSGRIFHRVPKAGHMLNWENPDEVNKLLLQFAHITM